MSLPIVFDIVSQSDEFWGNSTLNVIRMITSTCKGFRTGMLGDENVFAANPKRPNKKHQQEEQKQRLPNIIIKQALLAMIKSRPSALEDWSLSFLDVKYRFSLHVDVLIKHCAALPVEDEFHLTAVNIPRCKAGYFFPYIGFLDAYELAVNCGLKACMERRNKYEDKVRHSAYELIDEVRDLFAPMRSNIHRALKELKKVLCDLKKEDVLPAASSSNKKVKVSELNKKKVSELNKSIRLLDSLHLDLWTASRNLNTIRFMARQFREFDPVTLSRRVSELKTSKKSTVMRYKTHSKICPEMLTMGCLDGIH